MRYFLNRLFAWGLTLFAFGLISLICSPNIAHSYVSSLWDVLFVNLVGVLSWFCAPAFYLWNNEGTMLVLAAAGFILVSLTILCYGLRSRWSDLKLMGICMMPFLVFPLFVGIHATGKSDLSFMEVIIVYLPLGGSVAYFANFGLGLGILKLIKKLPT